MRWWKFNAVGWMGAAVQLAVLSLGIAAGVSLLPATALAVETALVHNYIWHARWTWRGRQESSPQRARGRPQFASVSGPRAPFCGRIPGSFWRFQISNGLVSLASNLILTQALADWTGLPAIGANLVAIAATGLLNFWIGDRWVFPALDHRNPRLAASTE